MFCCEVLKEPVMIVVTTVPYHLHFYLFNARITTKEKLLSVKVLKLRKIHFREKIQYGYRLLVCVWVGIKRVEFLIINLHLPLPSKIIREGGGASKLVKWKLPYSPLKIGLNKKGISDLQRCRSVSYWSCLQDRSFYLHKRTHLYQRDQI